MKISGFAPAVRVGDFRAYAVIQAIGAFLPAPR